MREGEPERALEMLDKCQEVMKNYPLETVPLGFSGNDYMVVNIISNYYKLGQPEKARPIAVQLANELLVTANFYLEYYDWGSEEFELAGTYIYLLAEELEGTPDEELGKQLVSTFLKLMNVEDEAEAGDES